RAGRLADAAAARQHGTCADGARSDRRGACAPAGCVLRAERHVHAVLVSEGTERRPARRASSDSAFADRAEGQAGHGPKPRVGGLASEAAKLLPGGDHSKSSATFLTGTAFKRETVFAGVSMDQIAAKEFGTETQLASLELCIEDPGLTGSCDGGPTCAYLNTISWRTPTTPLPMENDPRAVFERMFGVTNSTDPAARLARLKKDHSILDYVSSDAARLRLTIGPQDNLRVAEYFEAIRDIERRIKKAQDQALEQLPVVDQPIGIPTDYAEHATLMMDLLALAFQTDLTRISTFML